MGNALLGIFGYQLVAAQKSTPSVAPSGLPLGLPLYIYIISGIVLISIIVTVVVILTRKDSEEPSSTTQADVSRALSSDQQTNILISQTAGLLRRAGENYPAQGLPDACIRVPNDVTKYGSDTSAPIIIDSHGAHALPSGDQCPDNLTCEPYGAWIASTTAAAVAKQEKGGGQTEPTQENPVATIGERSWIQGPCTTECKLAGRRECNDRVFNYNQIENQPRIPSSWAPTRRELESYGGEIPPDYVPGIPARCQDNCAPYFTSPNYSIGLDAYKIQSNDPARASELDPGEVYVMGEGPTITLNIRNNVPLTGKSIILVKSGQENRGKCKGCLTAGLSPNVGDAGFDCGDECTDDCGQFKCRPPNSCRNGTIPEADHLDGPGIVFELIQLPEFEIRETASRYWFRKQNTNEYLVKVIDPATPQGQTREEDSKTALLLVDPFPYIHPESIQNQINPDDLVFGVHTLNGLSNSDGSSSLDLTEAGDSCADKACAIVPYDSGGVTANALRSVSVGERTPPFLRAAANELSVTGSPSEVKPWGWPLPEQKETGGTSQTSKYKNADYKDFVNSFCWKFLPQCRGRTVTDNMRPEPFDRIPTTVLSQGFGCIAAGRVGQFDSSVTISGGQQAPALAASPTGQAEVPAETTSCEEGDTSCATTEPNSQDFF